MTTGMTMARAVTWPARGLAALAAVLALAGTTPAALAATTLHFVIDLREEIAAGRFDPALDIVGVRGAAPPLSWNRTLWAVGDEGRYRLSVRLDDAVGPDTQPLAYKFKIERPGQPGDGWEPGANRSLVLRDGEQRVERAFGSGGEPPALRRTGTIERLQAPAPAAGEPRGLQVWLPPGYATDIHRRYPVLYLLDGQNVFDAAAAGAEWGVDETAQRLVEAGQLAPLIIVAVDHGGARRLDEYTPWPGTVRPGEAAQGGGAARHARELAEGVKPLIDARYRTRPGAQDTAVGGASLGGLMAMWLALARPDVFGAALVSSPSVFWADDAILRAVAQADVPRPPRVWLAVGEQELPLMRDGAERLRAALAARGWAPTFELRPGGRHDEASWARGVEPMLRNLQGAR